MPTTPTSEAVAAEATRIVIDNITGYGNVLSGVHQKALGDMLAGMTALAFGETSGRFAYPLACGLGKTQSVVALCAAIHRTVAGKSVAISASRVESLCELKAHLINAGVPAEQIGLIHAYKHHPLAISTPGGFASMSSTDNNDQRQFVLCTHNRVRGGMLDQFYNYRGAKRDLLVWDESLLVGDARSMSYLSLQQWLGYWAPTATAPTQRQALAYITTALELIGQELARQQAHIERYGKPTEPTPVSLPELDTAQLCAFKAATGSDFRLECLRQLIEWSVSPLRVIYTGFQHGQGLVSYDVGVPAQLTSVAVLDASYPIRELERLDPSIRPGMTVPPDIKRHENVVIHRLQHGAGRDSMTKDFSGDRNALAEVVDVIKGIPANEAVIVWCFKTSNAKRHAGRAGHRAIDFVKIITTALQDAGVDTRATVKGGRPRIIFRTWGQETGDSTYSYAQNVVFAGVLHRDALSLAAEIVAQRDNLWGAVDGTEVRRVMNSEVAHAVYQALCRGSCRMIEGNQAHPMKVWLMHHDHGELRAALDEVMPGLQWRDWPSHHVKPAKVAKRKGTTVRGKMAQTIENYLRGTPDQSISVRALRAAIKAPAHGNTFQRALAAILSGPGALWERRGRTLVRVAPFPTFTGSATATQG